MSNFLAYAPTNTTYTGSDTTFGTRSDPDLSEDEVIWSDNESILLSGPGRHAAAAGDDDDEDMEIEGEGAEDVGTAADAVEEEEDEIDAAEDGVAADPDYVGSPPPAGPQLPGTYPPLCC
jgi:hypothetical protein